MSIHNDCGDHGEIETFNALNFIERLENYSYSYSDGEVLKFLQKTNLKDLNKRSSMGNYLLHICANWGFSSCVSFLIDKGFDLNIRNMYDETPLILSLKYNSKNCAKILLNKNADVNICDRMNQTPLSVATSQNDILVMKLLILNGGDPFDKRGSYTAIESIGSLFNLMQLLGDQFFNVINRYFKIKLRVV